MDDQRPNPDELLEQIREEEKVKAGGKLKIFFGYAAGVGKTYSMLESAREQALENVDIVLGYVQPHARPETEALMLGLEILPAKEVEYKGIKLKEFDLDAALKRKPAVLIVDELAHTNAPGLRHTKRWQDVEELLAAGISVYTTLNVQHLESLNDIVTRISSIAVRETVPDTVFDNADSIELVDLPPEDLLQRFEEGKVYVPTDAERAMLKFFKLPNLVALRELAMRRTADRLSSQIQAVGGDRMWSSRERLLVCVGPSPTSARLIRVTKRMAMALRAPWIAAYVDTGYPLGADAHQKLARNLNLAEQLGAETVTLGGEDVAEELLKYAQSRNVTKIVIGKTDEPRWREITGQSIISRLLRSSGDIDIYVIRGKKDPVNESKYEHRQVGAGRRVINYLPFGKAIIAVAICTGVACLMKWAGLSGTNQAMVFILGVAYIAARHGLCPGILASVAGVLAFDFFLVPPYFSFNVSDTEYFITFAVMLVIAVLISTLAHRIHLQVETMRQRQWRTEALYRLSRKLASTAGISQLVAEAQKQLSETLSSEVSIFLPEGFDSSIASGAGRLKPVVGRGSGFAAVEKEIAVAQWAYEHNQIAGAGTDTLPDAIAIYVPMTCPRGVIGVLGVKSYEQGRFAVPDQRQILEMAADQLALSIERDRLAEQAQQVLKLKGAV
jgi:two-component system sensor histidine kinase KdpD